MMAEAFGVDNWMKAGYINTEREMGTIGVK